MTAPPTELAIIQKSLDDIMRRLEGAPQTPMIQQLAGRALAFRRFVAAWESELPPQNVRSETVQKVLGMHIDLMRAGIQHDEPAPDSH